MNKGKTLLALVAASVAMFALPTAASAQSWHLSATTNFTFHSNGSGLTQNTSGTAFECKSMSGSGSFTTTTSGTLSLLFHGCKHELGIACTTAGQPAGTVSVNNLEFDVAMIEHNGETRPGVLITPPANSAIETSNPTRRLFAAYNCFGIPIRMIGNGIIGTITEPRCGQASTGMTLVFQPSATPGHQTHQSYTGTNYDLESSVAGGNHSTVSIEALASITFPAARTINCT